MKTCLRIFRKVPVTLALMAALAAVSGLYAQDAMPRIEPTTAPSATEPQEDVNPSPSATVDSATPEIQHSASYGGEAGVGSDYVIGSEDVLKIQVFEVPDMDETVRVSNDGTIVMPLLGRLIASGLTPDQLRKSIEQKLGKNLVQNPQVSVYVQEFHAQPVSVIGAVEKPGLYQITGPRTVVEMLSMAGGLAKRNSAPAGSTLYVTRSGGFGDLPQVPGMQLAAPDKVAINIKDLLYSHEDALNIPIKPHDIISVAKADVIYVTGRGVQKPGGFILEDRDKITVVQALAMAEGLSSSAAQSQARILRTQADGSKVEIRVNIKKILKDKAPDPALAANDILFVPDSAQKAALKRSSEVILSTLSGILIFRP